MAWILVLDDDPVIADLMKVVLEEEGFDAVTADTLSTVPEGFRPDCVVADLLDVHVYTVAVAQDVTRRLTERFPGCPLVIVTAHAEAASDALAVAEVVIKPFDVDGFVAAVRRVLAT